MNNWRTLNLSSFIPFGKHIMLIDVDGPAGGQALEPVSQQILTD